MVFLLVPKDRHWGPVDANRKERVIAYDFPSMYSSTPVSELRRYKGAHSLALPLLNTNKLLESQIIKTSSSGRGRYNVCNSDGLGI
jgi:hypothetical protein